MEVVNKKARFDYTLEKELEAGIELCGTEVKSIRKGSVDLKDTFVTIKNNEAYILNMYIARYEEGNQFNHDERRTRKLLFHKKEILKLKSEIKENGKTIVPVKLYMKNGKVKILVAIAKGKKLFDKRESLKKKDLEREQRRY